MNLSRKGKLGAVAVVVVALVAGVSAYAVTKHTSNASAATSGGAPATAATAHDGRRGFGGGFRGGPGGGSLSAAATYLGLGSTDLVTQMQNGKTLAQIANATSGKSSSGLIDAMVSAEETQIEQSVTSGQVTRSQADQIEADLKTRVTAMVNGTGFGGPPGGDHGFGGPGDGDGRGGNGGTPPTATTPTQHI
jgi:hypothetical protein